MGHFDYYPDVSVEKYQLFNCSFLDSVRFFSISDCPFSFVCGFIVFYKSKVVNRFLFGQNDVSAFYRIGTKNAGITGIPAFSSIYVEEAQPAGDSSSCLTVMEDTL